MYDKLVTKANAIDNSGLDLKTQYNTDKSDLEKKIDDAENTWWENTWFLDLLKNRFKCQDH